ncbi:hypothetical protein HQ45_02715 [Porphyromonas crevioricanis]|nr:hypothetical protein HQ45_02715 [Porphyromonas crevioricanis]
MGRDLTIFINFPGKAGKGVGKIEVVLVSVDVQSWVIEIPVWKLFCQDYKRIIDKTTLIWIYLSM